MPHNAMERAGTDFGRRLREKTQQLRNKKDESSEFRRVPKSTTRPDEGTPTSGVIFYFKLRSKKDDPDDWLGYALGQS